MSIRNNQRIREIFDAVLDVEKPERLAELARLSNGDSDLEMRVRQLLDAYEKATAFDSVIIPDAKVEFEDPKTIGPYRVKKRIGEGGMGVVYLAEQQHPIKREVAIKIIRPGMASAEIINRFNAERQALAMMSHPGIARILDGGTTEQGLPYFVMEYVEGIPLQKYCDRFRLDLRDRIVLLREACLAVHHAHQKGIIHRDLKPSNILVSEVSGKPTPKIIDFGIAKAVSEPLTEKTLQTRAGIIVGTPDYMSPEQISPGNVDIDTRSDVYALGVLLYELLSSRLPYDFNAQAIRESEILQRLQLTDPLPPSRRARDADVDDAANRGRGDVYALRRALRGELDWIALKALSHDRNLRYESAQSLAEELQRFLNNEPVMAGPPTFGYRMQKFVRRHVIGVMAVATSFVLLGSFAVVMALQVEETRKERDRANREAGIAHEVTAFTAGIFELADPGLIGSNDVSARDLLDAGIRRIRQQSLSDNPEVGAALLEAGSNAYIGLGEFEKAEKLLLEALFLRELGNSYDVSAHAKSLMTLARIKHRQGDFTAAETEGRKAYELLKNASPPDPELEFEALIALAGTIRTNARLDDAAALLDEELFRERRANGTLKQRAAATLELARLKLEQGEVDPAIALLEESVQLHRESSGELADGTMTARTKLGDALLIKGDYARAEPILQQLVDDKRKIYGDTHPEVGIALNNLGNALSDIPDRLDDSEVAYKEGLAINLAALGNAHPEVAVLYNNLGALYLYQQRWEDAERAYDEAIRIRMTALGEEHSLTAAAMTGRALALNRLDRFAEAETLLQRAMNTHAKILGDDNWRTANTRAYLGLVQSNLGKYPVAETNLRKAIADLGSALGEDHRRTLNGRIALGELFIRTGNLVEARPMLVNVHAAFMDSLGPDHQRTQRAQELLAQLEAAETARP